MKYGHILSYVRNVIWAIDPEKLDEIVSILTFRAAGGSFTPEEIQARIGAPAPAVTAPSGSAIAVVPLRGVIAHRMGTMDESSGGMSAERFTKMIEIAAADPQVATILIDCDSPGGTIPGVPEAADTVFAARASKKIVAIANGQMCSAALWICSQAHEIVGLPSLVEPKIGSIGAYAVHGDMSEHLKKEGIKITVISAGKYKTEGNPWEPISEEFYARQKASAEAVTAQFTKAVARGRGVSASDVAKNYGEGRALSSAEALKVGMIDRIATLDETIARLSSHQGRSRVGMKAEAGTYDLSDPAAALLQIEIDAETVKVETGVAARELEAARALQAQLVGEDEDRDRRISRY